MAKLAAVAEAPLPGAGKQVIEEKKTTTIDLPPGHASQPAARGPRRKSPHINVWFAGLPPDERANEYSYSLYRDDSRIIIVDENLDDRASGAMLDKFTPDQIRQWPEGPFLQELASWTKARYGGGRFHIMVVMRKGSTLVYNKGFEIEGEPILSSREQYKDGMGPLPGARGESATFVPMIMKMIDEKLSAVTMGKQDSASAFSEVMKAGMEANSKAFQWAMENMPKSADPATQLQTMQFMFNMMKEVFDKREVAPAVNPLEQFTQFVTILKTVRDVDRDGHPPAAAAPVTVVPTGQGPELKELVREAVATAVGKSENNWGVFAAQVISSPAGANLLAGLGNLAAAGAGWLRTRFAAGVPAQQPQPGTVTISRGGRMRGAMPQGAPVQPPPGGRMQRGTIQAPQTPETHPAEQAAPGTPAEQIEVSEEVVQAVLFENALQRFVDSFEHDEPGNVVAGAIDRMYPQLAVQMRFMTDDMIQKFIETNATLARIKNDPRLPKFLEEFKGYFKQIEDGGEA